MSRSIKFKCGYCSALTVSHVDKIYNKIDISREGFVLAQCNNCENGSTFHLKMLEYGNIEHFFSTNGGRMNGKYRILGQLPNKTLNIPSGMPELVHLVYERAEKAYSDGHWEPSATHYRKALEQACKDLGHVSEPNLYRKIEAAHKALQFTDSLKDWAHEIRGFGNDSTHDDPLPNDEARKLANETREFCELFMIYVYTMPARIAAAVPTVAPVVVAAAGGGTS